MGPGNFEGRVDQQNTKGTHRVLTCSVYARVNRVQGARSVFHWLPSFQHWPGISCGIPIIQMYEPPPLPIPLVSPWQFQDGPRRTLCPKVQFFIATDYMWYCTDDKRPKSSRCDTRCHLSERLLNTLKTPPFVSQIRDFRWECRPGMCKYNTSSTSYSTYISSYCVVVPSSWLRVKFHERSEESDSPAEHVCLRWVVIS